MLDEKRKDIMNKCSRDLFGMDTRLTCSRAPLHTFWSHRGPRIMMLTPVALGHVGASARSKQIPASVGPYQYGLRLTGPPCGVSTGTRRFRVVGSTQGEVDDQAVAARDVGSGREQIECCLFADIPLVVVPRRVCDDAPIHISCRDGSRVDSSRKMQITRNARNVRRRSA